MPSVLRPQATALITGAASGVGFATAKLCREKGMHLALVDIDSANLQKAKDILTGLNASLKTEAYAIDVADQAAWTDLGKKVTETFGEVDLLMLNAGKNFKAEGQAEGGRIKTWTDVGYWKKTLDVNVFGLLNGLSVFLPLLITSPNKSPKSIVLTGSKQGITNPPGGANPAYNSSKATVKHIAEHLAHDLRSDASTSHISVHLLIPGWTWTGFMGNVGPTDEKEVQKRDGAWYPSQVAEYLSKGLDDGAFYILCPDDETDRALDQARMRWAIDDVIEGRPALSRWEESWKGKAEEWIQTEAKNRRNAA
ncbi:putative NADP(+)-dependent dehydrogenase [Thermoascus aurantiacus ATCC 26904]